MVLGLGMDAAPLAAHAMAARSVLAMNRTRCVLFGCGVMGRRIAEALHDKSNIEIIGAVDTDQALGGTDLGELFESPKTIGVKIGPDPDPPLEKSNAQIALIATTSHLDDVSPLILRSLDSGLNVVSTCEELSYPWHRNPELAQNIDRVSKENGVSVVGTGINPGYLMDTLPLFLTAPSLRVDRVEVVRVIDSAKRRVPFQRKIGTGLTTTRFNELINAGIITGHVGLLESLYMVADGLEWILDDAVETAPRAAVAKSRLVTGVGLVQPGEVIGLSSVASGMIGGGRSYVSSSTPTQPSKKSTTKSSLMGFPRSTRR